MPFQDGKSPESQYAKTLKVVIFAHGLTLKGVSERRYIAAWDLG